MSMQNTALMPSKSMGSIVLVEDNVRISQELAQILTAAGMLTRCAMDAEQMRELLARYVPDIVLLDLNLPGEDGISLCKWLRKVYPSIGIVMLTARVMGSDRAMGYQAGADVYLTKPTRPEEILAVLSNFLRRVNMQVNDQALQASSAWILHVADMRLESPAQEHLRLNLKETVILQNLAECSGVVSYQTLLDVLLGAGEVGDINKGQLDVIVSRLRTKLASLENPSLAINTVHKAGYQLSHALAVSLKSRAKN
jgi:DNA-binding response OmpR family regulator